MSRLIDADAFIAEHCADCKYANVNGICTKEAPLCGSVQIVTELPTIDAVEVVHGRWIHTAIEDDNWGGTFHKWTCSNCDFSTGHNPNGTNYCPNCGAKMDGDGNA